VQTRLVKVRGLAWKLAIPAACLAVAGQLGLAGTASATHTVAAAHHTVGTIQPNKMHNMLDCNMTGLRRLCTDPHGAYDGKAARFLDHGVYVGHDEPSVKFISGLAGSGNTMTYGMQLSRDPSTTPTPSGSVTKYAQLSVAPWFGLPMCDPQSYPQNPCTPDSDTNTGLGASSDAGSAFMELQFYPPGFKPFIDNVSCSRTQWCAALTIDSLECSFNFASCNPNCIEPVNFAFLQTNGVPAGPPAPQDPSVSTFLGNANTLKMNPGDVLKVSISDPAGGFTTTVQDLTTGKTGTMVASAANGFADTNMSDCSGNSFTWHAEYNTAKKANQVPWAALEGGVLMEQEIGHGESCSSVSHRLGFAASLSGPSSYVDPKVYQTCNGGNEGKTSTGKPKAGEGPCSLSTHICTNAKTQGLTGPVACPKQRFTSGALCEFADGFCFPKGSRSVLINGNPATETSPVAECSQNAFQNGDLDFDGLSYRADWPNGSSSHPTTIRYVGPFTNGQTYSSIQFETDVAGSERLCNIGTGHNCTAPPLGARFYPFWSMNKKQALKGLSSSGSCVWNFGNVISGLTATSFGKDAQYGTPHVARYGGTLISKVRANPELATGCKPITPF
jgi:hypothetical protein